MLSRNWVPFQAIGYLSSGMSFVAAFAAGAAAGRGGDKSFLSMLSGALCLVVILLTLGFLLSYGKMNSAGVLSVASFTMAGYLTGNLLFGSSSNGKKRRLSYAKRKKYERT